MPSHPARGLLAALVASLLILVCASAAAAAPNLELKIAAPKNADALIDELEVTATCAEACKAGLQSVNVLRFDKAKQQQSGAAAQDLTTSKNLKAGQKAVFRVALGPEVRAHIQTALIEKQVAVVQVVPTLDGSEWGYRTASIRTSAGPKIPGLGQDEIVVPKKIKTQGPGTRYRVTVEGVQTTTWKLDENDHDENGCTTWARGEGTQTIKFRTAEQTTLLFDYVSRGSAALYSKDGWLSYANLNFDITRDGKFETGVTGENCGDTDGCLECDGHTPPPCDRTGSREKFSALLFIDDQGRLQASSSAANKQHFYKKPNCAIEPFKGALGDIDLLGAAHRFGDPRKHGAGGKVIVVARNSRKESIQEGQGFTNTTVRWTVTFKRLG